MRKKSMAVLLACLFLLSADASAVVRDYEMIMAESDGSSSEETKDEKDRQDGVQTPVSTDDTKEEALKEPAEAAAKEPARDPAEAAADEPAEETAEPAADEPAEEPAEEKVNSLQVEDKVYVIGKRVPVLETPDDAGTVVGITGIGHKFKRTEVLENGWSKGKVKAVGKNAPWLEGYVRNVHLNDTNPLVKVNDAVTLASDGEVLDFPGFKNGNVIGTVSKDDILERSAEVYGEWSRVLFMTDKNTERMGYIPSSMLVGYSPVPTEVPEQEADNPTGDGEIPVSGVVEAGVIHKSTGVGIFADAVNEVSAEGGVTVDENGVQVGSAIAASSDDTLIPLGTFRITHYCPCSICNGPYTNGITSTGVTAVTNHTIAVDPSQIPYGSKVVINGQVYVAEDCGGAIKHNCIDVYVATHEECNRKGVFYTEVYLVK